MYHGTVILTIHFHLYPYKLNVEAWGLLDMVLPCVESCEIKCL